MSPFLVHPNLPDSRPIRHSKVTLIICSTLLRIILAILHVSLICSMSSGDFISIPIGNGSGESKKYQYQVFHFIQKIVFACMSSLIALVDSFLICLRLSNNDCMLLYVLFVRVSLNNWLLVPYSVFRSKVFYDLNRMYCLFECQLF